MWAQPTIPWLPPHSGGGEEAHDGVGAEEGEEFGLFDGFQEGDGMGGVETGDGDGGREELGALLLGGEAVAVEGSLFLVEGFEGSIDEVDAAGFLGSRGAVGGDDLRREGLDFGGVAGGKVR